MAQIKRVVMVLWDGFGSNFLHHIPKLPSLQGLIYDSVFYPQVESVYPTITTVSWASMMTGAYPERTRNLAYYWDRERNVVQGAHREYHLESIVEALGRGGRSSGSVGMFMLLNHGLKWESEGGHGRLYLQPRDTFENRVTEAIRFLSGDYGYVPDFLTVYTSALDGLCHSFGPDDPRILDLLRTMDHHLGRLLHAIGQLPDAAQTAVILTADHGFSPAQVSVREDVTQSLAQAGYHITWLNNGESAGQDCDLIGVAPGRTASIYFGNRRTSTGARPFSEAEKAHVRQVLAETPCVARVLGPHDLRALRTDLRFGDLVIEPVIPYAFWARTPEGMHGTHSSMEERHVPCILSIPGVTPKEKVGGRTIDIAPTVCELLGAPMPADAQGNPLMLN